jgi:hypothetical protein
MARPASGADQIEAARASLKSAKTADQLRAAQAVLLPLELGLTLPADGHCHRPLSRGDLQNAHHVLCCGCWRACGS